MNSRIDAVGRPWIGVDLDGTLAEYDHWRGMAHIGRPVPEMIARVKAYLRAGHDVRIFTARVCPQQRQTDIDTALIAITRWCVAHLGRQLPITCVKDWGMVALWDDRCRQIRTNTGRPVENELQSQLAECRRQIAGHNQENDCLIRRLDHRRDRNRELRARCDELHRANEQLKIENMQLKMQLERLRRNTAGKEQS